MSANLISVIVNLDTREGFGNDSTSAETLGVGCRSMDFLKDGILNKKAFLKGHNYELIVFVDEHCRIPDDLLNWLRDQCDRLVISRHSKRYRDSEHFHKHNDINYLQALMMARGGWVMHFDGDCAAFAKDGGVIDSMTTRLDSGTDYVSHPSHASPNAVDDPNFDHMWVSTRFFLCKRETLKFDEIERCLRDPEYMFGTYGEKKRRLSWMEHVLGIICGSSVFYPPMDLDSCAIFCWNNYRVGTLAKLNAMPYEQVSGILKCHTPFDYNGVNSDLLHLS